MSEKVRVAFHINMCQLLSDKMIDNIVEDTNKRIQEDTFYDTCVSSHWLVVHSGDHEVSIVTRTEKEDSSPTYDVPVIAGHIHMLQDRLMLQFEEDRPTYDELL